MIEYEGKKTVRAVIDEKNTEGIKEKKNKRKHNHFMVGRVSFVVGNYLTEGDRMMATGVEFYTTMHWILINKNLLNNKIYKAKTSG
jgi:hypothetical protein